jgi:hypothetical protein
MEKLLPSSYENSVAVKNRANMHKFSFDYKTSRSVHLGLALREE